jgi:hypothetical protein
MEESDQASLKDSHSSSKFQIRKIMMFLKGWLWSLGIVVIALSIEIWMIPPTKSVYLRVWLKIMSLETI